MQGDGIQIGCTANGQFQIEDFIWGKIHGHLWWPGKVCNPSHASEEARCLEHLDHQVLVSYFGGITFAWCEPSELKHFKEEFEHIVDQNLSQSFIDAVKDAMHEIESCLRSDMTCYCVPPEIVGEFRISRSIDIGKASMANYSPVAFLNHLQDVAQDVSIANMLDVSMLRSWAASFYLRNGCFIKMIEGLFDEKQTDLNSLPENFTKDKRGLETGRRVVKGPQISGDEACGKKRSMAELIMLADPGVVLHNREKEDKLGIVENETEGHINLGLLLNQKKKPRIRETEKRMISVAKVTRIMLEEENGSTRRERKKSKYLSPPYTTGYERSNSFKLVDSDVSENDSKFSQHLHSNFPAYIGGFEASKKDDDPMACLSNDNEASAHDMLKKLLFAAVNPIHLGRNFQTESVMEFFVKHRSLVYSEFLEFDSLAEQRGDSSTLGNHLMHAMESNEVSSGKKRNDQKNESNQEITLGIHEKRKKVKKDQITTKTIKSYCLNGVDTSTGRSRYREKRGAYAALNAGVESSTHITINSLGEGKIEEESSKSTGMVNDGKASQTGNEPLICSSHKRMRNGDFNNGEYKTDFSKINYGNPGKILSNSKRTKHVEDNNENSVALLLTFSPGSTLPSKDELLSVFTKYGALIKHETELFRDPGCARVVFVRASDAKKALSGIRKGKNFPLLVVDCRPFDLSQCMDSPPSQSNPNASLLCISKDLQRMIHALSPKKSPTSHGLKPDVRNDLINDINGLLNKVKKLIT